MCTRISVASEVDHPNIVVQIRQLKTQALLSSSHDDISRGWLVSVKVQNHLRGEWEDDNLGGKGGIISYYFPDTSLSSVIVFRNSERLEVIFSWCDPRCYQGWPVKREDIAVRSRHLVSLCWVASFLYQIHSADKTSNVSYILILYLYFIYI